MALLFSALSLKDVRLRNRIAVPPMCQYRAVDGIANSWHFTHYAALARGGAALVIVEATAVSPDGRITNGCTGLWSEAHIEAQARIAASIKQAGAVPGIQIGHAGRKASANLPWEGDHHLAPNDPSGWETISPSAVAFGADLPQVPRAMSLGDIERVKADFASAAARARDAGFEWLELHFAHGYLAHSFFSIHANHRDDDYGGDPERRGRFLVKTLDAVRREWPERFPLTIRFGVVEFDGRDEETLAEAIDLSRTFALHGTDLLSVSIGMSTPEAAIPWSAGMLAAITQRVRRETGLPVATAWLLDKPEAAERALAEGQLDLVMVGRAHLRNPHYPYQAAFALADKNAGNILPISYSYWLNSYPGAEPAT